MNPFILVKGEWYRVISSLSFKIISSPKNTVKTPKSQYIKPEKTLLVRFKVALLDRQYIKRANWFNITFSKDHVMTGTDISKLDA